MTVKILFAGFGGQGILSMGKFLAYKGLVEDKEVSWLPSYGPEMRGGTASCNVILSDSPVGSPIVTWPDVLVAMNLPSLDKYEDSVVPGGKIFVDSTLIERKVKRTDVDAFYIPATAYAAKQGMPALANMVILGKIMRECPDIGYGDMNTILGKAISQKHQDMIPANLKAIEEGYNYIG